MIFNTSKKSKKESIVTDRKKIPKEYGRITPKYADEQQGELIMLMMKLFDITNTQLGLANQLYVSTQGYKPLNDTVTTYLKNLHQYSNLILDEIGELSTVRLTVNQLVKKIDDATIPYFENIQALEKTYKNVEKIVDDDVPMDDMLKAKYIVFSNHYLNIATAANTMNINIPTLIYDLKNDLNKQFIIKKEP